MPEYRVQVRVDFDFTVECANEAEAEAQGWLWEDYTMHSEVYSIDVEDITEIDEEEEETI